MNELKTLMMRSPRWTLAVGESLTVGHVQARIGEISGASAFFRGGVTAYSLEQKVRLLGVDRATAERVNCVSAEIAEQMARGVCALFDVDVGVATTGYAEASAAEGIAMPFAWWAIAVRQVRRPSQGSREVSRAPQHAAAFHLRHGRVECPGASRVEAQAMVAEAAIAELVAMLRELRSS